METPKDRDELTERLFALAQMQAGKYSRFGTIPADDLVQETMLNLMDFINSYDGSLSVSLYETVKISLGHAVGKYLKQQGVGRMTDKRNHAIMRIIKTKRNMAQCLGCAITAEDVAAEMRIPVAICRMALELTGFYSPLYLDAPIHDSSDTMLAYIVPDDIYKRPEQIVMLRDLHTQMARVLSTLEPLEEMTIRLRYGFIDDEEFSASETAEQLKIPLDIELRTEIKAMRKLRHPSRSKYLEAYL